MPGCLRKNEVAQRWQKKVARVRRLYLCDRRIQSRHSGGVEERARITPIRNGTESRRLLSAMGRRRRPRDRTVRLIAIELQMAPTRTGVHIQGADFMAVWKGGKQITELLVSPPERRRHAGSAGLVDQGTQGCARTSGDCRRCIAAAQLRSLKEDMMSIRPIKRIASRRRPSKAPASSCVALSASEDQRVRSLPAVRRFPQRPSRRLSGRLSMASASRHRDHHLRAGRHGRARRQPRQHGQARRRRRPVDDRGQRHPASGDAARRRARGACTASSSGPICPRR